MIRFLPIALFFLLFMIESLFVELFPVRFLSNDRIIVPHFLFSAILLFTIYGNKKLGLIYGLLFGLLFDIVYTEIIGIYLFMFPATAYLISKIMKILQANLVITTFIVLFAIIILELAVYEINILIHITAMPFSPFIFQRLIPTLILNIVFLIIMIYPLRKQFEKFNVELA